MQIGQLVFKTVNDNFLEELAKLLEPTASDSNKRAENRKRVECQQEEFSKRLRGKVVAEFHTIAEPIRARERGEEETRRALELITYAYAALHPFDLYADAVESLAAELPRLGPWIPVVAPGEFHFHQSRTPTSLSIRLTASVLERFETVGFWSLADCLARPIQALSDLDKTLLRAVHWFAASQTQTELENRLLNLVTCLEALVGPKDRAPINASVAEGVAIVVAQGYENRRGVKKFLTALYGARSGISYGGAKAVADSDVKELRWIVTTLLTTLTRWRDGLRTRDALLEWLEQARLSGEPTSPPITTTSKTLRALREERALTQQELAHKVGRLSVDEQSIDRWERWQPSPPSPELRLLASALGVRLEAITLPPRERWVNVRNHLFHLTARREGDGRWIARVTGYDPTDAVEWPVRAVDPAYPASDSPVIIVNEKWEARGFTADKSLSALADRIATAMERALHKQRLPDEPPDWHPPELPRHWQEHLEVRRKQGL